MKQNKAVLFAIIFTFGTPFAAPAVKKGDMLSCVELEGFRNAHQAQYCVGSRESKGHAIVFYSTPQDRKVIENTADCINAEKGNSDNPTVYYVVNKKRINIPVMILRNMLNLRSKKSPDNTYCIDNDERLPAVWKIDPQQAHIVVLDKNGVVAFNGILPLKQLECTELKETLSNYIP